MRRLWGRLATVGALALLAIGAGSATAMANEAGTGLDRISAAVASVYARSPVLLIGAGIALAMPLLASVALVLRRARSYRGTDATEVPNTAEAIVSGRLSAWIETHDGTGAARHRLDGELIRIGRERDNDVRLEDDTVHRYHAIIQRYDEGFVVHDVSGEDGNGVTVNGRRLAAAALVDGDRVGLGRVTLTFSSRFE